MGQSVKLKIAGKEYSLTAASEEQEQLMRLAARDVNEMLDRFNDSSACIPGFSGCPSC